MLSIDTISPGVKVSFLLPHFGSLDERVSEFTVEKWHEIVDNLTPTTLKVFIPRFKVDSCCLCCSTRSFAHLPTHSLAHSLISSLAHSLTQLLAHMLTCSLAHVITRSHNYLFIQLLAHPARSLRWTRVATAWQETLELVERQICANLAVEPLLA